MPCEDLFCLLGTLAAKRLRRSKKARASARVASDLARQRAEGREMEGRHLHPSSISTALKPLGAGWKPQESGPYMPLIIGCFSSRKLPAQKWHLRCVTVWE